MRRTIIWLKYVYVVLICRGKILFETHHNMVEICLRCFNVEGKSYLRRTIIWLKYVYVVLM